MRTAASVLCIFVLFPASSVVGSGHAPFLIASDWQKYPGYQGSVDATQFQGHLKVEAGPSSNEVLLSGAMTGLPGGTFGIHIHSGFDGTNKDTVGGHFYPGLEADPWNDVFYTGPNWTIEPKISVPGINFESTVGRVVVIHDATDRVGIAKLLPYSVPVNDAIKMPAAHLSPFEGYHHLTTSLGPYPDSDAKGEASVSANSRVWLTENDDGTYVVHYDLQGLPAAETSGGIHVHTGTSCATHEEIMGHYFTTAEDPWTTDWTKTAGETRAKGSVQVGNPGFELGMNEHHAFVVHQNDGKRIACGILHSSATASVASVSNSGLSGSVWLSEIDSSTGKLRVSYELSGLPSGVNEGGLHIHAGKECANPGAHFWLEGEDPWVATKWSRADDTVTVAVGFFDIDSGYSLAENADHTVMVHGPDGYIGCGVIEYVPSVTGFVHAVKDGTTVSIDGNIAGLSAHQCEATFGSACAVSLAPAESCTLQPESAPERLALEDGNLMQLRTPAGGLTATETGIEAGTSGGYVVAFDVTVDADAEVEGHVLVVHNAHGHIVACGAIDEVALTGLSAVEIAALAESAIEGGEEEGAEESGAGRVSVSAPAALLSAIALLLAVRA